MVTVMVYFTLGNSLEYNKCIDDADKIMTTCHIAEVGVMCTAAAVMSAASSAGHSSRRMNILTKMKLIQNLLSMLCDDEIFLSLSFLMGEKPPINVLFHSSSVLWLFLLCSNY